MVSLKNLIGLTFFVCIKTLKALIHICTVLQVYIMLVLICMDSDMLICHMMPAYLLYHTLIGFVLVSVQNCLYCGVFVDSLGLLVINNTINCFSFSLILCSACTSHRDSL